MRKTESFERVYGRTVGRAKLRLRQRISSASSWIAKLQKKLLQRPDQRDAIQQRMAVATARLAALRVELAAEA